MRAVWTNYTDMSFYIPICHFIYRYVIFQSRYIDRYTKDSSARFSGNSSFDIMTGVSSKICLILLINLGLLACIIGRHYP